MLVPHSHADGTFEAVCARARQRSGGDRLGAFVRLDATRDGADAAVAARAVQAVLEPGDLLLWDSRVVHCNQGVDPRVRRADGCAATRGARASAPLSRLVAYVSMTPAERATSPALAEARARCVREGFTTGHDVLAAPRRGRGARGEAAQGWRAPPPGDPCWALV